MINSKAKKYLLYGSAALTSIAAIFAPDEDVQQSLQVAESVLKKQGMEKEDIQAEPHVSLTLYRQLQEHRVTLNGNSRDLFYVAKPPPPKPLKPEPPRAPSFPFTYMGSILKNGELTIFLTRGNKPYVVNAGDVLDGQYHVDAINPPLMEITYIPLNEVHRLNIGVSK